MVIYCTCVSNFAILFADVGLWLERGHTISNNMRTGATLVSGTKDDRDTPRIELEKAQKAAQKKKQQ